MSLFSGQEFLISVIIPTRNKPEYLFVTLLSFCLQTLPSGQFEVLVICNGENEESFQLNSYLSKIEYPFILKVFNLEIGNPSNARNVGINYAQGKYIVFVDDDCPVAENFLENHLKSQINVKNHFIVGYTIGIDAENYLTQIKQSLIEKQHTVMLHKNDIAQKLNQLSQSETSFLLSRMANAYHKNFSNQTMSLHFPHWILFVPRNLSISRDKFQLFDTEFKGWGMEDWELGYRLYELGIRAMVNQKCINYHLSHGTSSRQYASLLRNCWLFLKKHPEYQAFLGVRFDPRSIDDPSIVDQSIFAITLEDFVKSCHQYNQKNSLQKQLALSIAKIKANCHLISELPKAFSGTTLRD
jgi:glycosyltransferase involved in cell wall biosynthesis